MNNAILDTTISNSMSQLLSYQDSNNKMVKSLDARDVLDTSMLPFFLQEFLDLYLCKINPNVPKSVLLQMCIAIFSKIACSRRVKLDNKLNFAYPNIYSMTFARSGIGKDKPLADLRLATKPYEADLTQRKGSYYYVKKQKLLTEAQNISDERKKENFIREGMVRPLIETFGNATREAYYLTRQDWREANFGGTFVLMSEFGDYFSDPSPVKHDFLSGIMESYDGFMGAKIIKSEIPQDEETVNGLDPCPSVCLLFTSPDKLLDAKYQPKFHDFLASGWARRSFICFPHEDEMVKNTTIKSSKDAFFEEVAEQMENDKVAFSEVTKLQDFISYFLVNHKNPFAGKMYNTDNVWFFLKSYEKYNQLRAAVISNRILSIEIAGRHWKAFKLSGVIAAFAHPEVKEILHEDFCQAVYITEFFGNQLARFLDQAVESKTNKLFDYLNDRKDTWFTSSELLETCFTPKHGFSKWLKDQMPIIDELCVLNNCNLETEKFGKNGTRYRITDAASKVLTVNLSFSHEMTKDFIWKAIPYKQLHEHLCKEIEYSAIRFKNNYTEENKYKKKKDPEKMKYKQNNYRHSNNAIVNGINCIVLDFDDGLTMKEASEKIFNEFDHFVHTTKSHNIDKKGLTCERFRLILPTNPIDLKPEKFKLLMKAIMYRFKGKADEACSDLSRKFTGYLVSTYYYHEGIRNFDWKDIDIEAYEALEISKNKAKALASRLPNQNKNTNLTFEQKYFTSDQFEKLYQMCKTEKSQEKGRNCYFAGLSLWFKSLVEKGEISTYEKAREKVIEIFEHYPDHSDGFDHRELETILRGKL